ncbi:MAG TPA: hypothetical protein VJR30_21120 [Bradyrhizobium sp.]|nr:hypothetical protein [Bradyrhizobium sp.]
MRLAALALVLLHVALSSPAQADPRDVLRNCQALLDRANQSNAEKPSEADIARCRQVVRDWALRDSRMLVDEDGKPLR